jgi:toxin FitB
VGAPVARSAARCHVGLQCILSTTSEGAAELKPGRHRHSVITRAELFAGNTASALTTRLLAPFREVAVDREIAERAGRVAREFGLQLADALIAASALERGLQLSTRSTKDSRRCEACAFEHCVEAHGDVSSASPIACWPIKRREG